MCNAILTIFPSSASGNVTCDSISGFSEVRLYHIYCLSLIQETSWSVREGNEIGLSDFFLGNPCCLFLITLLSLRSLKIDCLIICFSIFPVIESRVTAFHSLTAFPFGRTGAVSALLSQSSSFFVNSQCISVSSLYTVQWPPPGLDNLRTSN